MERYREKVVSFCAQRLILELVHLKIIIFAHTRESLLELIDQRILLDRLFAIFLILRMILYILGDHLAGGHIRLLQFVRGTIVIVTTEFSSESLLTC